MSRADPNSAQYKEDFVDVGADEHKPIKTIINQDEGDIILCENMVLPISGQHLLTYVSQRGSLYLHDLRARHNVSSERELFGCQRGLPTCMTIGQDPYQLYIGTLGGYVMIYDIRYNITSSYYKHSSRAPINSIATFHPNRQNSILTLNKSDSSSPMAMIATGTCGYELSLVNLESS